MHRDIEELLLKSMSPKERRRRDSVGFVTFGLMIVLFLLIFHMVSK